MEIKAVMGIILAVVLASMLATATNLAFGAGQTNGWWDANWKYRVPIMITENSGFDLTDYQILVTIDTASLIAQGKMRSDCGDVRFTDSDDNEIPYWIESGINSANTKIWIKVPSIPAGGTETIYMYYGNPDAISTSNGDATFEFFDDFNAGLGKWTNFGSPSPITFQSAEFHDGWGYSTNGDSWYPSGSYSNMLVEVADGKTVEVRLKVADGWSDWDYLGIGMGSLQTGYDDRTTLAETFFMIHASGAQYPDGLEDVIAYHNPWWDHPHSLAAYIEPNDFAWHRYTIKYDPLTTNATYYQNGIFKVSNSSGPMPYGSLPIVICGRDVSDTNFLDYVFARKYASLEPTITIGLEESFPPAVLVKLSGEHDYLFMERVKIRLAALVRDAYTMEPVSNANVTVDIYDPDGNLWISSEMEEKLEGTGIYEWESDETILELMAHRYEDRLKKGIYLVHVQASYRGGPVASDILMFHIDPPTEKPTSIPIHYYAVAITIVLCAIGLIMLRRRIYSQFRKAV
jgi:predicted small secreted protein